MGQAFSSPNTLRKTAERAIGTQAASRSGKDWRLTLDQDKRARQEGVYTFRGCQLSNLSRTATVIRGATVFEHVCGSGTPRRPVYSG